MLILLLFGVSAPALAQEGNGKRSVELTAGTNHSKFSEDVDGAECLLCWFIGADVVLCENGPLRFSTGMHYRGSGSKYKSGEDIGEGGSYSFENKEALNYLYIPVEARYEFGTRKIKPFVRGGGMLGFLLSAKSKTTMTFNGRKDEEETDIKARKKSTNFALSLGAGLSFPLGKYRGIASVRYLIGLTNVVKDDRAPSAKTRDLSYSVGIGIPIL